MAINKLELEAGLRAGDFVRYTWAKNRAELVSDDPRDTPRRIDGRAYAGFLKHNSWLVRTETGSAENRDLVIEWRPRVPSFAPNRSIGGTEAEAGKGIHAPCGQ